MGGAIIFNLHMRKQGARRSGTSCGTIQAALWPQQVPMETRRNAALLPSSLKRRLAFWLQGRLLWPCASKLSPLEYATTCHFLVSAY